MKPVILSDLDDTLFTTLKGYPERDLGTLRRVTTAKNGNHSYMCDRRDAILTWVAAGATLIPVTARSIDAYRRVCLGEHFLDGAILSNGALILNRDGTEDLDWNDQVVDLCATAQPTLEKAAALIEAAPCDVRILRHMHAEVMLGMTVKSNVETETGLILNLGTAETVFRKAFPFTNISVHRNGNNLAFTPGGVSKRAAVAYLLATRADLHGRPTIGAGDSESDLPFMELCDMALVPANTQNSKRLFSQKGGQRG